MKSRAFFPHALLLSMGMVFSSHASAALIAYYGMDGNLIDSVGGHNGSIAGTGVAPTADRFGNSNSAYFFGGNGYVTVGNYGLSGGTATYSAWASWTGAGAPMLFNTLGANPGPDLFFFNNEISWNTYDSAGNPFAATPASATDGRFHNYTTVIDGSASTAQLYYDGNLIGNAVYHAPQNSLSIGGDINGYYWTGKIDDFAVYDTALSANEVAALYARGLQNNVSEPSILLLIGVGLGALAFPRRRSQTTPGLFRQPGL